MENIYKKKIILASASPRRQELLKTLISEFDIIPSPYIEKMESHKFSYKIIENLAFNKAYEVAKDIKEPSLIIGADTVVVLDDFIMGKPKDKNEAFEMLHSLSGRQHFVVTSICVIEAPSMRKKIHSSTSYVTFNDLSDEMINNYIEKYNPLDKAGSYGIQELPHDFIKSVGGSFENIIGLCPKSLKKTLSVFKP